MRVAIYQPRYFPQLHYFNRALTSDIFVLFDSAQYTKSLVHFVDGKRVRHKSYQADTPIKLNDGVHLLTVPVKNGLFPLCQTALETTPWARKHIATIQTGYGKSSHFSTMFQEVRSLLASPYPSLSDLNVKTFLWGITRILGVQIPMEELTIENVNCHLPRSSFRLSQIVTVSDLGVERPPGIQKGAEWTTAICKKVEATEYQHGATAAQGYMDEKYYTENDIALVEQKWKCAEYAQQFNESAPFIPNLSIIDLLGNVSQEEAQKIMAG